jgi:hypothetical protein
MRFEWISNMGYPLVIFLTNTYFLFLHFSLLLDNHMDELPHEANKILPKHQRTPSSGNSGEVCTGGEVSNVMSDVGLYYGSCPVCTAGFVYLPTKNAWMAEEEFERLLTESPPDVSSV